MKKLRKFIVAIFGISVITILVFLGKISDTVFQYCFIATIGIMTGGNVYEHHVRTRGGNNNEI